MEDRLLKLLDSEQLSSSKFADVIGVQRSSVSHILSGRNKPSFDFIQKTLKAFPLLNADWLILGNGDMYTDMRNYVSGALFEQEGPIRKNSLSEIDKTDVESNIKDTDLSSNATNISEISGYMSDSDQSEEFGKHEQSSSKPCKIRKVILFYEDNTFQTYEAGKENG